MQYQSIPTTMPQGLLAHGARAAASLSDAVEETHLQEFPKVLRLAPPEGGFAIHAARSGSQWQRAQHLVSQRYAQRGYLRMPVAPSAEPQLFTLSASSEAGTLGTLGVRLDSEQGLKADEVFPDEMRLLRADDHRVCEFTQLALEHGTVSTAVLAGLFHAAHLYAHRLNQVELLVIEVNPRHVAYYRRMLGFQICSEARMNPRVQAPAVLMSLDLAYAQRQIDQLGGGRASAGQRSLYPQFYGPAEQAQLLDELFSQHEVQVLQAA